MKARVKLCTNIFAGPNQDVVLPLEFCTAGPECFRVRSITVDLNWSDGRPVCTKADVTLVSLSK